MTGSVYYAKDRGQWVVSWYWQGKPWKLTRYRGQLMKKTHPKDDPRLDYGLACANKLLAQIQGDYENYLQGLAPFKMEKYTGKGWTDVLEYNKKWLKTKKKNKPATYKGYKSYLKCHFGPFFENHQVLLHEIQLDTLDKLLRSLKTVKHRAPKNGKCPKCKNPLALSDSEFWYCRICEWQEIPLSPKSKYNVMNAFHTFLDYAWRAKRIPEMPPFPKKSDYSLVEPIPEWVNSERLFRIIGFIPKEHQPVFLWMYYHLMRTAEACALHWEDWDELNQVFFVNRSISARKLVDSTKTGEIYLTPCHSDFLPCMKRLNKSADRFESPFIFKNPRARKKGRRYTNESLNTIWKAACKKADETISLYGGMRHSRASQMYNELKMSIHEIKEAGTWKRLESVRRYAKTELTRKRELLE
ncbi:MAG: tyrosine-type recombinase/integrase, partial [Desulfobacterales bacterium]